MRLHVDRALAGIMELGAVVQILGAAAVEGAVFAAEDVEVEHVQSLVSRLAI